MRLLICALLFVTVTGCGQAVSDAPQRVRVEGRVTYAGKPIDDGTIHFVPADGPVTMAQIRDGQYLAEARGGVPVGKSLVQIQAFRPVRDANDDDDGLQIHGDTPEKEQYLPKEYSDRVLTTLEALIEPGSDQIVLDFDLD